MIVTNQHLHILKAYISELSSASHQPSFNIIVMMTIMIIIMIIVILVIIMIIIMIGIILSISISSCLSVSRERRRELQPLSTSWLICTVLIFHCYLLLLLLLLAPTGALISSDRSSYSDALPL